MQALNKDNTFIVGPSVCMRFKVLHLAQNENL
jgi:hypothetical protein